MSYLEILRTNIYIYKYTYLQLIKFYNLAFSPKLSVVGSSLVLYKKINNPHVSGFEIIGFKLIDHY